MQPPRRHRQQSFSVAVGKMENLLSQSQDNGIHGLDFPSRSNTAPYVEDRSEQTWFPSGSSFNPNGVNTLRVSSCGPHIVDLSSSVLVGTWNNGVATHQLKPLTCGVHGRVERLTCYVSSAKADDILEYGR